MNQRKSFKHLISIQLLKPLLTNRSHQICGRSVPELKGIIPNSFAHIFGHIAKSGEDKNFLVDIIPSKMNIIPSKLEVAPPPKCQSGVGDWIPLRMLRRLEHLAVLKINNQTCCSCLKLILKLSRFVFRILRFTMKMSATF